MDPRLSTRNARFQQWQALLTNRTKRHRAGEFLVQGVRPITLAARSGWPVRTLLYDADRRLSGWATDLLASLTAQRFAVDSGLMAELGGKDDEPPELLAVLAIPPDDLARITLSGNGLVVILDRPASPGNLGTVIRSADAFGVAGIVACGHAADPYDPRAVRASTGSLFSLPVVRADTAEPVIGWARRHGLTLIGTDESGALDVAHQDLTGPTALLIGNEGAGLSATWRGAADAMVRIPIGGGASSLNAATAAGIVLYETARQRRTVGPA
jgi:23S rRNA (uridine2479-2'-O)-methyltransferase